MDPLSKLTAALAAVSDDEVLTLADQARRLSLLDDLMAEVTRQRDDLVLSLAESMDEDTMQVPGVGWLHRERKYSTTGSDWRGARLAAMSEAVRLASVDRATGEVRNDWHQVAAQTADLLDRSLALGAPKGGFTSALGLDPDEFIHKSWYSKVSLKEKP